MRKEHWKSKKGESLATMHSKYSKTVLISDNSDLLKRLIFVLCYFVRLTRKCKELNFSTNSSFQPLNSGSDGIDNIDKHSDSENQIVTLSTFISNTKLQNIDMATRTPRTLSYQTQDALSFIDKESIDNFPSNDLQHKVSFVVGNSDGSFESEVRLTNKTQEDKNRKEYNVKIIPLGNTSR